MKNTFIKVVLTLGLTVTTVFTGAIQVKAVNNDPEYKLGETAENEAINKQSLGKSSITLQQRSKDEIRLLEAKLKHSGNGNSFTGEKYVAKPVLKAPYNAGKLTDTYINDGLNAINMVRYIAGFPADITTNSEYNTYSQHGATLLATLNKLTHYPSRPDDMTEEFYNNAYKGTSSSNLAAGWGYNGNFTIARTILLYMNDSDGYNIDRVGHRRWMLNPQLKNVGLGYAMNSGGNEYSSTYVFDSSRTEKVNYDYISWPAKGVHPYEYFGKGQAWSVSLNLEKYATVQYEDVKVSVKRLRDNKTWVLDKNTPKSNASNSNLDYFTTDNGGYGLRNTIIFRPGNIDEYRDGDKFEISISGIYDKSNNPTNIKYTTEFFSAKQPVSNDWKTHWAVNEIQAAMNKGWVNNSNYFRPDDAITRAEFIKIVNNAFGFKSAVATENFTDVKQGDWFYDEVRIALKAGYITSKNSSFRPNDSISREEVASIITSIKNNKSSDTSILNKYTDANKISEWAKTSVIGAIKAGYMGKNSTIFNPKNNITRAEAVTTLYRVVN